MVYKFDPTYFNGTIFHLDEATWEMSGDWDEYRPRNLPIPASCFPKSLTIDRASATLPDLFHASRGIILVSERARAVLDRLAPGEVEFIPVTVRAAPTTWLNPLLDALYSIRDFARMVMATLGARIPFYPDFWPFSECGRALMQLHTGYESIEPWPIKRRDRSPPIQQATALLKATNPTSSRAWRIRASPRRLFRT